MAQDMKQCTALNLSDEARCVETATSVNGLFCSLHSKQCQGMYRGYKIRNRRLDELEHSLPEYLSKSGVALANLTFQDIKSEETLREVYNHLALKHALLERVVRARKTHHRHFFSLNLDYGHQHYLDTLNSQKFIVLRALERLERRTAEVLYEQRKWFEWVRECQNTEEAQRDSEKKKTKQEAALFKRHQKETRLRMQELKAREDSKRQDAELDKAYYERLSQQEKEKAEEDWDPIEDIVENERRTYVDLIKHFLLMSSLTLDESSDDVSKSHNETKSQSEPVTECQVAATHTVSRSKAARKKPATTQAKDVPDKSLHETRADIRRRLGEGVELSYAGGVHIAGTIDSPIQQTKSAPIPDEEIDKILEELAQIKLLLLCRLLLSQATALPSALRASNVAEFFDDKEVSDADLRDLCLKMDNPGLQNIRDACADFGRGPEEIEDQFDEPKQQKSEEKKKKADRPSKALRMPRFPRLPRRSRDAIPEKWSSDRERRSKKREEMSQYVLDGLESQSLKTMIDFGNIEDDGSFQSRKMRVTICGKEIYNYRSEKAVSRGGWLHFSILAKDSDLNKAIELCRNWDEFWELNILSIYRYFPAANWLRWKGNYTRQQLLQLGLVPYFQYTDAEEHTSRQQTGARGQQYRRSHAISEHRNFMCCHIKRNDPASRRFCQYLSMLSDRVLVLIRDVKTGQILTKPPEAPENQNWLARKKVGLGRASRNEWQVTLEVGPKLFETIDEQRDWHFSFDEYYDIFVWDFRPGLSFSELYNAVHDTLVKALRCCEMKDMYARAAPILKSLAREPETFRTRDAREGEETILDTIMRGKPQWMDMARQTVAEKRHDEIFYNEADALEDLVLFPEEQSGGSALFKPSKSAVEKLVGRVPNFFRFVYDLDTDDETSSSESDEEDNSLRNNETSEGEGHELAIRTKPQSPATSDDGAQKTEESSESEDDGGQTCEDDSGTEGDSDSTDSALKKFLEEVAPEDRQDLASMDGWKCPKRWGTGDPQAEFMTFMDREKSRSFKRTWHEADLTPNAEAMYEEACQIIKQMVQYNYKMAPFKWCHDLRFLDVHPDENKRVVPDIEEARAMMMLFFPSEFLDSELGEGFKDSILLRQAERASQGTPKIRSHTSNKYRPQSFWTDWDQMRKERGFGFETIPRDWDKCIRPIIAKLYKAGVIGTAHLFYPPGQAIARTEPEHDPDLYIDFRLIQDEIRLGPELEKNLPSKEQLLLAAGKYAKAHPSARFALLRLWSAPHFYPLMLGFDRRDSTSFSDILGRTWEWKFIPKDMPFSELSMHHSSKLRIEPFRHLLGKNVLFSRNLFLVMGENESDLCKFAIATTFAIQTNPWRLEVDLWRSFVNIDLEFLQGLADQWME